MKFLWTTTDRFVSETIRTWLGTESSHTGLLFFDTIVIHASPWGTKLEWYDDFRKHNRLIRELSPKVEITHDDEHIIFGRVCKEFHGTVYDYMAFAFWTLAAAKHYYLGSEIPTKNEWGKKSLPLCTRLFRSVIDNTDFDWGVDWPKDFDMVVPDHLFNLMVKSPILRSSHG